MVVFVEATAQNGRLRDVDMVGGIGHDGLGTGIAILIDVCHGDVGHHPHEGNGIPCGLWGDNNDRTAGVGINVIIARGPNGVVVAMVQSDGGCISGGSRRVAIRLVG